MSSRLTLFGVLTATVALLAGMPVDAHAAVILGRTGSFGTLSEPNNVAVDQANGQVFVADVASDAIHVYTRKSADEYEEIGKITGEETPTKAFGVGAGLPMPVAVDSVTGAVYVADLFHSVVDRFVPTGPGKYKYECQITGWHAGCHPNASGEEGTPEPHFHFTTGLAIASNGNLFVSDYANETVDEFTAGAEDVGQIKTTNLTREPADLAVDTLGDLYVNALTNPVQKFKIDLATGAVEGEQANFNSAQTRGVAVDSATGDVYGAEVSQVSSYTSSGEGLAHSTIEGMLSEGVAINESSGEIIASDRGHEDVEVLGPVIVPDAVTGASSAVTKTTAMVSGAVNPDGEGEVHYHFAYGASTALGQETSEATTTTAKEVHAELAGLAPATTYYYKLIASNKNGVNETAAEGSLTTPPAVTMAPCPPVELRATSVSLCVAIDPEGSETSYRFEYGETTGYGLFAPLPSGELEKAGSANETTQHEAPITGLLPATTYHYRVLATNEIDGFSETAGPDQELTTPVAEPAVNGQPPVATEITPTEATLHGAVNPGKGVTTYTFVYGTSASYGASSSEAYTQLNYENDPVEAHIGGLKPGVTYHYALSATNTSGTATGPDQTFTTPALPSTPQGEEPQTGTPLNAAANPGLVQPLTPGLLATPAIAFPGEPETSHSSTGAPKPLTNAQKLVKALKACHARHSRRNRVLCEHQARKRYAQHRR